jgi:hypothetical protein
MYESSSSSEVSESDESLRQKRHRERETLEIPLRWVEEALEEEDELELELPESRRTSFRRRERAPLRVDAETSESALALLRRRAAAALRSGVGARAGCGS